MGINIEVQDKVLIVAPHPDDESIGCGGLLAMYSSQCDVLLITDGDNGTFSFGLADVREKEFVAAVTFAGVQKYECLRIPEHSIKSNSDIIAKIDFGQYTHIFVPNRYEAHKDHLDVYKTIKKFANKKAKLYEYEVWTPIRKPNIYLNITEVVEKKKMMIKYHDSQMKTVNYVDMALGLNAYRGIGHGFSYAECYYCEEEKRKQDIRRLKRKIKSIINNGNKIKKGYKDEKK